VVANQVYHWEGILDEMITLIKAGALGGQSFKANLANGGEVVEYNPDYALPEEAKALADSTIQGIIDGTVTITLP
jgi:basic membrane protein A